MLSRRAVGLYTVFTYHVAPAVVEERYRRSSRGDTFTFLASMRVAYYFGEVS